MNSLKEGKRSQIMLAAEKLFTSCRFHEITLDDVAREARVGKGTIYLYFADKDDLFFQTATCGLEELCALLNSKPAGLSFLEEISWACGQINSFLETRRQLFRLMDGEDARLAMSRANANERWKEKRKILVAALAKIIRQGVESGHIRNDVTPEVMADFLLGMMKTWARDLDYQPGGEAGKQLVIDMFCNGASQKAS